MGLGVSGQNICCHVAALNDRLLKKLNFDPRVGGGGGGGLGVCGQNICYYVAAFVIPLNLIYNMTMFRKKLISDLLTQSPG